MKEATYEAFVAARLAQGEDPNDIVRQIGRSLRALATDWIERGDGRWEFDGVCPECGWGSACAHPTTQRVGRSVYERQRQERRAHKLLSEVLSENNWQWIASH